MSPRDFGGSRHPAAARRHGIAGRPDLGPESRKGAAPGVFPKEHAMAPTDNGRQIPESSVEE